MSRSALLRYADGHILYGQGGGVSALYRIETVSYPYLGERRQEEWFWRLWRFAYGIEANFSLWRVCRTYPADRYRPENLGLLDIRHQHPEAWADYLRGHEAHLSTLRSFTVEVYLAVTLDKAEVRKPKGPIRQQRYAAMRAAELGVRDRVLAHLPGRPATTRELQWLLARAGSRGVAEPYLDGHWEPRALTALDGDEHAIEPLADEFLPLTDAAVYEDRRALVCDADAGRSYQAMLAMGTLPEFLAFPDGSELLFNPLERVPFPVDACVHAEWKDNPSMQAVVRGKVRDADIVFDEAQHGEHGPLSDKQAKVREKARDLLSELEAPDSPPMLRTSVGLAVGAPTAEELESRVAATRRAFGSVALHRPLGLQWRMFFDHMPRTDSPSDYERYLRLHEFAGLMPIATHEVGSATGPYVAHTVFGGRRPVRHDTREASQEGRAPATLAAGTNGAGKSIFLELLAYQEERRGGMVIDVDPTPSHRLHELPELAGRSHVIDLDDAEAFRGELDPLIIAAPSRREDAAASYYMEILPSGSPAAWETQIRKATRAVLLEGGACGHKVIERLERAENDDARNAGEALAVWAEAGITKLGFASSARRETKEFAPYTAIRPGALTLPHPSTPRENYTPIERISAASLGLVAMYAMAQANDDRSVHKLLVLDEAGILLATPGGQRLASDLVLQGRAKNVTVAFGAQFFAHIGDLAKLIGTLAVFGQESREEAMQALDYLGLDRTDERMISEVMGYRRGLCLMRDIHGRVGKVKVDLVYPRLLDALDTTPPGARLHEAA